MSGREVFVRDYGVAPATLARLDAYAALLIEWQARMNLVARSTLPELWQRHFADSAQLAALVDAGQMTDATWLDLGSGAGFPALVVALWIPARFRLVEATTKKCRFLAAAAEVLGITDRVTIDNRRIESLPAVAADVITARACAPLGQLFAWGEASGRHARWLLPKGRTVAAEICEAQASFTFDHTLVASRTDPDARIVDASNVRRRG